MRYLAAAIVLASATSAFADLVTNGSFETGPSVSSSVGHTLLTAVDSTSMSSWTVSSGTIDYIGGSSPYWTAANGSASLDLNGTSQGAIQQTITTTVNQQYTLSFMMSVNPDAGSGASRTLSYSAVGSGTDLSGSITSSVGSSQTYTNMGWTQYSFIFYASATSTVLTFTGDSGGGGYGPALDQVSVLATPEPGALALFAAGLGGLGLWRGLRRKGRRAPKA
jgi:choice-of-anchor C domain-containing protein